MIGAKSNSVVSYLSENVPDLKAVFLMDNSGKIIQYKIRNSWKEYSVLEDMAKDLAFLIRNLRLFNHTKFDVMRMKEEVVAVRPLSDDSSVVLILDEVILNRFAKITSDKLLN